MEAEALYRHLGRIIEAAPAFPAGGHLSPEQMRWIGQARALVQESGDEKAIAEFDRATQYLNTAGRGSAFQNIMLSLHKALGVAELRAPPSAQGAFIPVNRRFDAFAAIHKILQSATIDILVVDPYLDETILTEFGGSVPDKVSLRLLADETSVRPSLAPASKAWAAQHGTQRPLAVRVAGPKSLHDRVILVDKAIAWTATQSFKDFAKRSPAELVRADDTAALKIAAYKSIWTTAQVVI